MELEDRKEHYRNEIAAALVKRGILFDRIKYIDDAVESLNKELIKLENEDE